MRRFVSFRFVAERACRVDSVRFLTIELRIRSVFTGSALALQNTDGQVDRCAFNNNLRLVNPNAAAISTFIFFDVFPINCQNGGAAIVYTSAREGCCLENAGLLPLAVSNTNFKKNVAVGPGGAIATYQTGLPGLVESGRVKFRKNVSQQNATLSDVAVDLEVFT